MGINFSAFYHALQAQVAQPAPQPAPVATPVAAPAPVESTPYGVASEAQSAAAEGMEAARAIGDAFAGFVATPPAPVEAPAASTTQSIIPTIQNAISPELLASIQERYQVTPEQRAATEAMLQGML